MQNNVPQPTLDDVNKAIAAQSQPSMADIDQAIAAQKGPSLGQKVLSGIGTAAKAVDSVTGAPTRAAIYAAQNDKPVWGLSLIHI